MSSLSPSSCVHEASPRYIIELDDIYKQFGSRRSTRGYSTVKGGCISLWNRIVRPRGREALAAREERAALSRLTLRIPEGSSVGIIGRNGSGKSTLLKVITGIYRPTGGSVAVRGKIAALIELGAGFHPDFTGRENVILGGIMQGLTRKQVESRMESIVDFAELQEAIDTPVRTYSSGMFMRLGFSLAMHTDPEILLIDEVLAVGDAAFVAKCKEKVADFRREKRTLLVVSHDLDSISRWCDEVVWLEKGRVQDRGEPRRVIDAYLSFIEHREDESLVAHDNQVAPRLEEAHPESDMSLSRWGAREVEVLDVLVTDSTGSPHHVFHSFDEVRICVRYRRHKDLSDIVFGLGLTRSDGVTVFGTNTHLQNLSLPHLPKEGEFEIHIPCLRLLEGIFRIDIAAHRSDGYPYDYRCGVGELRVRGGVPHQGISCIDHQWIFPHLTSEEVPSSHLGEKQYA
jgi:lipopolysaccharide transport system ATP-binding protein